MPGEIITCYQPTIEIELQYPFKKFQKEKEKYSSFSKHVATFLCHLQLKMFDDFVLLPTRGLGPTPGTS